MAREEVAVDNGGKRPSELQVFHIFLEYAPAEFPDCVRIHCHRILAFIEQAVGPQRG